MTASTFDFIIYRVTRAVDTEANIDVKFKVEMTDGLSDEAGKEIGLTGFHIVNDARKTDVPNPDQYTAKAPDTGMIPLLYELDFIVNEKVSLSKAIAKLQLWSLEDKIVRTPVSPETTAPYPEGRTGIIYKNKTWMNIVPTATVGGKLVHFDWDDSMYFGGMVTCKAFIQYVGKPTAMIAALNTFIG